mgnify:CR=1 FL=1
MSYDPNKHPPEPSPKQTFISVILFTLSVLVVTMIGGVALLIISDGEIMGFRGIPDQLDWIVDWLDGL